MDHRTRILHTYGISGEQHLASGMEADVYALDPNRVLKLYTNTTSLDQLTTLKHFYNSLDTAAVAFSLPQIESIAIEDGVIVSIEKRLYGTRLADRLPSLNAAQLEAVMRNYISAVHTISHITMQTGFDRYKLFDEEGISHKAHGDWHTFLVRFLAGKLTQLQPYLERDVTRFATKLAHINQILAQPYAGENRLIHGDFFPGNLLVDEKLQATALLDFGMMTMLGDPLFDIATGWVLFDMYDALKLGARARFLPILLETVGEKMRGRLHRYVLIYSLLTANTYSPTCEDGHYAWCAANLNDEALWQRVD